MPRFSSMRVRAVWTRLRLILPALALSGLFLFVTSARAGGPPTADNSPSAATSGPPFVYVANSSCNDIASPRGAVVGCGISAYSLDTTNGTLTQVTGSPFATGNDTNSVSMDPAARFLYATNENSRSISAFTINPSKGFLTPIAGSPFAAGGDPNDAKVHPSGKFLYVPNENDDDIWVYAINQTTGALTPIVGSPFAAGSGDDSIAFDPAGRFAYVTNGSGGSVSAYTINSSTGALTPVSGSPFMVGTEPDSSVVDRSGRFLYVANYGAATISAFSINSSTGALTAINGSPFDAGLADHIITDFTGKYIYIANDNSPKQKTKAPNSIQGMGVGAFSMNQSTGALTPLAGTPFTAGNSPSGVAIDNLNRFLIAANERSDNVSVFALDSGSGMLTTVGASPFGAGGEPVKVAITPQFFDIAPPAQVPESDTLVLFGTGLAGLAGYAGLRWRARRRAGA